MEQKKRYINIRFCLVMFVGIIAGILSFCSFLNLIFIRKFVFIQFAFLLIFFLAFAFLFVILYGKNNTLKKYLKYCVAFLVCFCIGVISFSIKFVVIKNYKTYDDKVSVVGDVASYGYQNNYYKIVLKNATADGEKIKGKMVVRIYLNTDLSDNISLGDEVSFSTTIKKSELITTKLNIPTYSNGEVYSANVSMTNVTIVDKKPNLIEAIQDRVRTVLDNNLNEENSAIAYSVLFGDKSRVSDELKTAFSYAGISHILAVSGLHVGFLVALVYFIIGLFKGGRRIKFFITAPILVLYCILCGFTSSVLRASIMCMIFMLSDVIGMQYDGLNSLGLAGFLILAFLPLSLFNLGFQLSFMCVFVIITLADRIMHLLNKKCHIPKWASGSITISLCVTIGTLPLCANTLGTVSLMSIVSNILVIPLFSITYPLLVVFTFFGVIWSKLGIFLAVPQLLLHFIKIIATFFANINFAHFKMFNLGYLIVLVFVMGCLVAKYLMVGTKAKSITLMCFALLFVCLTCIGAQPKTYHANNLIMSYQYDTASGVLTTKENKKILVGYDKYGTESMLKEAKINKLDAWILYDYSVSNLQTYEDFAKEYKVKAIILPRNCPIDDFSVVKLSKSSSVFKVEKQTYYDVNINFVTKGEVCAGVKIEINNKKLLFASGTTRAKLKIIDDNLDEKLTYLIINSSKYNIDTDYTINYDNLIYHNDVNFTIKTNYVCMKDKEYCIVRL